MAKGLQLPKGVWGTKGFTFWTLLSVLLVHARPKNILELGSGRSTSILADYANAYDAGFTSLETDRAWYNKACLDILYLNIKKQYVHLIGPNKAGTWYDVEAFRKFVNTGTPFDFIFVDAPNNARGRSNGIRNSPEGLREIKDCARDCAVMIVDDIHRRHLFESMDEMLSADYEKYYYDYRVLPDFLNSLCICIRKSSGIAAFMGDIDRIVGANLYRNFDSAKCPQP